MTTMTTTMTMRRAATTYDDSGHDNDNSGDEDKSGDNDNESNTAMTTATE